MTSLTSFAFGAGAAAGLALIVWAFARTKSRTAVAQASPANSFLPYRRLAAVLSPTELAFCNSLRSLDVSAILLSKVRLADLLEVDPSVTNDQTRRAAFREIALRHVDFVFVEPETAKPLLVIELDDRTHERPGTIQRDGMVNAALRKAGIPIVRFQAKRRYSAAEIRDAIDEAFADVRPN